MAYYKPINGLRTIAVTLVLFYHFYPNSMPYGYLGVDLFFVISGFVITTSLIRRSQETNFFSKFYSDRIMRLMPALAITILFSSILFSILWHAPGQALKTGIFAILGLSNIYLWFGKNDYFSQEAQFNPFTHTWSLSVEEQFYLIYPILFFVLCNQQSKLRLIIIILILGSMILNFVNLNSVINFYSPIHRAWEILIGCWIALNIQMLSKIQNFLNIATAQFVALALILAALISSHILQFEILIRQTLVVLGTALLVMTCDRESCLNNILKHRSFQLIGHGSYSIYLVHWPIKVFADFITPFQYINSFALLLSVITGLLLYHFIERPILQLSTSRHNKLKLTFIILIMSVSVIIILAFLGLGIHKKLKGYSYNYLALPTVQSSLEADFGSNTKFINSRSTILVIGDSHATNLVPSLNFISAEPVSYHGSIPFLTELYDESSIEDKNVEDLVGIPRELLRQRTIIFSLSRSRVYDNQYYHSSATERHDFANIDKLHNLEKFLVNLINYAIAYDSKFVIVDDLPYTCSAHEIRREFYISDKSCFISEELSKKDREALTAVYRLLIEKFSDIRYIDPHDELCIFGKCKVFFDGRPIYGDQSPHFSTHNPTILADQFKKRLNSLEN